MNFSSTVVFLWLFMERLLQWLDRDLRFIYSACWDFVSSILYYDIYSISLRWEIWDLARASNRESASLFNMMGSGFAKFALFIYFSEVKIYSYLISEKFFAISSFNDLCLPIWDFILLYIIISSCLKSFAADSLKWTSA